MSFFSTIPTKGMSDHVLRPSRIKGNIPEYVCPPWTILGQYELYDVSLFVGECQINHLLKMPRLLFSAIVSLKKFNGIYGLRDVVESPYVSLMLYGKFIIRFTENNVLGILETSIDD